MKSLRNKSTAENSQQTRSSQWKKFQEFCIRCNLCSLPATVQTVALYITFLSKTPEYSTVSNYTSAIVSFHHRFDTAAPDLSSFEIREALVGLQHIHRKRPYTRGPVGPGELQAIYKHLSCLNKEIWETFWAACVVVFFSLLRGSNLFRNSSRLRARLRVYDLTPSSQSIVMTVTVLKTNRHQGGRVSVSLRRLPDGHTLCPYRAVKKMLRLSQASGRDSLFSYRDSRRLHSSSAAQFRST